jgi:hypothetical protein
MIDNDDTEYSLLPVEAIPTFNSIDIRSLTIDRPEFPSEEFRDFVELITKRNLSDACGSEILKLSKKISRDDVILPTSVKQSRQFLDRMNVSHISFKKIPIMIYDEETYYFHHRQIFDAIKENQNIFQHCKFEFKRLFHKDHRIYHE